MSELPPMPSPEELSALSMLPKPTPGQIAGLIRRVNAANGWGQNFSFHDVPHFVALIHSEIVEADQEAQLADRHRELGDVIVRALDLAELLSPGELADLRWPLFGVLALDERALLDLHAHATAVLETYRRQPDETVARGEMVTDLAQLTVDAQLLIRAGGSDPLAILAEIVQKNSLRGHRHGGRRI